MMNKRPWIVPIPDTPFMPAERKYRGRRHSSERGAGKNIDAVLDTMQMSEVFGGSPIKKTDHD